MYERIVHIITLITRLAAGTLLVPITLIAGLMTTPATCQCGADLPHAHALVGFAGHHHNDDGSQSIRDDGEVVASGQDGVTVQAPAGSTLQAHTALNASAARLLTFPHTGVPPTSTLIPDGLRAVPDVPPPRA